MIVHELTPAQWSSLSQGAHMSCFGENAGNIYDRMSYALLLVNSQTDDPMAYVTIREVDSTTAHWQYGGTFPGVRQTILAYGACEKFVGFCKTRYERISTLVENTNTPMLKMAIKLGFKIIGVRNFKGSILVEHLLEF